MPVPGASGLIELSDRSSEYCVYWIPQTPMWWGILVPSSAGSLNTQKGAVQFSSVQLLSRVWLFATPWTAARQASLSITNSRSWSHGPQPCLTQWNYEPCCVGPPKTDKSWWRALMKRGPLEKGMANHFSILTLRAPWTVWKGKKIGHWKMNSPGQ